ncbi:MAG: tRNA-dihydrouridine synthase [Clostridia bacterium]|jgi:nifR3 family TIM-barrel protein|nr:tRNA-U20-dihydrouridine synthase [Clostridiales bacterium]MDK2986268.1 tRNA-dihydrouridine synthase [Clostridia bacterium]
MKIGNVTLPDLVIAAPMAGVTDKAFRIIAREFGCGLVFTEMVSDKAILHNNKKTRAIFDISGEERPVGVQIFGSEPQEMARAAQVVEENGASIIDINMGCPTPKIVKNKEGSALMLEPERAEKIVRSVVKAVSVPVTVKMRKGWDEKNINCVEISQRVQEAGAVAVTIHGRTREQFYSGQADWDIIRAVVKTVDIPVIGNGDIWSGNDAKRMIDYTGCAAVMVARGSMGNPWLFRDAVRCIEGLEELPPPTPVERIKLAKRHLKLVVRFKGEKIGVKEMRKHLAWYIKGLKNASKMRTEIFKLNTLQDVEEKLDEYEKSFKNS